MLVSGALAVVEEGPEAAAVQVIQDGQQEALVELEGCGELRKRKKKKRRRGHHSVSLVLLFSVAVVYLIFCTTC